MAEPVFEIEDEPEMPAEDEIVSLEPEDPSKAPFEYDEDALNLVFELEEHPRGKKWLKTFANEKLEQIDDAWSGSEEYREMTSKNWAIAAGKMPKNKAYPDAPNPHAPILLENLCRVTFTVKGQIFDQGDILAVKPVGPDDQRASEIKSIHGNWQLRNKIPDFTRQLGDRGLLTYFFVGDVTCHSYWDPVVEQNRHEVLTVDEFIVPYTLVTTMPDYSDVPWYAKVIHRYAHELEDMDGEWAGVREVLENEKPSWNDEPETLMSDQVSQVMGIEPPEVDKSAPYKLYHYEGWEKLPNQDRSRWVKAIIERRSQTVLFLQFHEEEDWQDRQRFDRELGELEQYHGDQQRYQSEAQAIQAMQQGLETRRQQGLMAPGMDASVDQEIMARQQALMPAMGLPEWANAEDEDPYPNEPKRIPVRMFAHGVLIEPLVGAFGISYGRIWADHNRTADVALNQYAIGGALANSWPIITAAGFEMPDGLIVGPGTINRSNYSGDDIRKAFIELKPTPPDQSLLELVKHATESAQKNTQSSDILSGQPGKSGETAYGVGLRREQALTVISVPAKSYCTNFLTQVLRNNAKLNATFLDDEEIPMVLNHLMLGQPGDEMLQLGRELYANKYDVEILADMRFASQSQRVSEADEVTMLVMQFIQAMAVTPPWALDLAYEGYRAALDARGKKDLIPKLELAYQQLKAQPPPQAPPGAPPAQGQAPPNPGPEAQAQ